MSIMSCGAETEGSLPISAGARWEGLLAPQPYPTLRRNQATSVSRLRSCSQKPERRKQVKVCCGCGAGRGAFEVW